MGNTTPKPLIGEACLFFNVSFFTRLAMHKSEAMSACALYPEIHTWPVLNSSTCAAWRDALPITGELSVILRERSSSSSTLCLQMHFFENLKFKEL